ncbi:MAG: hypothetical protein PHP50_01360 [Lachnospiraceae bacterium]|nr:hypothetical protein [Lachnospiraceae bacterium]
MAETFEDKLNNSTSYEELIALKKWLFAENIRVAAQRADLLELNEKLIAERVKHQHELDAMNQKLTAEKQRLKQDSLFFDKKMQILQDGFRQLDMDRRRFEKERKKAEADERERFENFSYHGMNAQVEFLFYGVRSPLALKKRYKDLIKIFHPDNMAGDTELIQMINVEYEKLLDAYEAGRRA